MGCAFRNFAQVLNIKFLKRGGISQKILTPFIFPIGEKMRKRKQIEKQIKEENELMGEVGVGKDTFELLVLELLLDIRDLLRKK